MEMAKATDTISIKVTDPKSGMIFEFSDVPIERIGSVRSQFSQNGHADVKDTSAPNYGEMKKSLSENAKKFLKILRENPTGISADLLAQKMGFRTGTQIGGMTGGGLSKNANKFHIELTDVYTLDITLKDGQRLVAYKPGKEISRLL